tara:strand:+ start:1364 stop:1489 length:126 start_codon:yes stop_codon:yes gene_type:complete
LKIVIEGKNIRITTPEPQANGCQSSFGEWNNNAKKLEQNDE